VKEWGQEFFITFLSKLLHHEEKWLLTWVTVTFCYGMLRIRIVTRFIFNNMKFISCQTNYTFIKFICLAIYFVAHLTVCLL
jgi:hypothetical protein